MLNNTFYDKQFHLFCKTLDYGRIPYHISEDLWTPDFYEGLNLRHTMGLTDNLLYAKEIYERTMQNNILNYISDEFYCHYILFALPDTHPTQYVTIGPYITDNDKRNVHEFLDSIAPSWASILQNAYKQICRLPNENSLNALVYAFADSIWGENNYQLEHYSNGIIETTLATLNQPDPQWRQDIQSNIEMVEQFYADENALMYAVSHGQTARAKTILSNLPSFHFKHSAEPLQNLKIFTIVLNTLFRKAAEHGGVHPIHVDQLSNTLIQRISEFSRADNILEFWNDMIQKYCSLVNNHATRSFSLPVQKVIIQINMDLSADLSLKTMAEYLNVNASYLSNLFRKETGETLTNYVNRKRMEYASILLTTTSLPIASIAQQCGILDDNYFTKLFKKQYSLTPTQFRDSIGKHDFSK